MAQPSQNTTIHGGEFIHVEGNFNPTINNTYPYNIHPRKQECMMSTHDDKKQALKTLLDNIVPGAMPDSEEQCDLPSCHPETRKVINNEIMDWATDVSFESKPILWLRGPAGGGKSSIMRTIVKRCQQQGILAAAFFFFRASPKRNVKTHLIATIAYQLSMNISGFENFLAYLPDTDIRAYLLSTMNNIKTQHPMARSIQSSWPSEDDIQKLVNAASGQFIYAATVLRFIECPRHNPTNRLDAALKARLASEDDISPFSQLDALYHQILSSVKYLDKVLETLNCLYYTVKRNECDWWAKRDINQGIPTKDIESVLGYSDGEVCVILCDMHSLIQITHIEDTRSSITPHHASLQDFLRDPLRSKHLHTDLEDVYQTVFMQFIRRHDELTQIKSFEWVIKHLTHLLSVATISTEIAAALKGHNIFNEIAYKELHFSGWQLIFLVDEFYQGVFEKSNAMDPPDVKLYDHFIHILDLWLAEILTNWISPGQHTAEDEKYHCIVLLATFATVPTPFSNFLHFHMYVSPVIHDWQDRNNGIFYSIETVTSNSNRHTYRVLNHTPGLLDRLIDHGRQFILEHSPWLENSGPNNFTVYLGACFGLWVQYLRDVLLLLEVKPPFGILLAKFTIAGEIVCELADTGLCIFTRDKYCRDLACTHGGYKEIEPLKQDLRSLAISVSNYVKKCGFEMDQHPYSPSHYICFSCQSTDAFDNDLDYGYDFIQPYRYGE